MSLLFFLHTFIEDIPHLLQPGESRKFHQRKNEERRMPVSRNTYPQLGGADDILKLLFTD